MTLERVAMPWPAALHGSGQAHCEHAERLARACGLLETERDRLRFRAFVRLDLFVFPYARLPRLAAAGAYNQWLYFLDDSYDDDAELGRDLPRVETVMARAFEVFSTGWLPPFATPFERFTARVRELLLPLAPPGWMGRFLGHTHDYLFHGSLEAMELWRDGGPRSLGHYLRVRAHDSAVYPVLDCSALALGAKLSPEVLSHPLVKELELRTVRHVALLNDVFSYQKEVLQHGSPVNLVQVLARERGVDFAQAAELAIEHVNGELQGFLAAERALSSAGMLTSDVALYLTGMKAWMRGNYDFSLRSRRFRAPDSPFVELRRARTISLELPAVRLPAAAPT